MACIVIYVIIAILAVYISIRVLLWVFLKIYHMQHSEIPKLKRRLLRGALVQKYGKKEGKRLFRETKAELFRRFKIR